MSNIINLTCPSCGGKLQITNEIDRFACGYCGNEQIVQRGGGIITLTPVVEGLKEVKTGVDKTASELAITRLEGEIAALVEQRNAINSTPTFTILLGLATLIIGCGGLMGVWASGIGDSVSFGMLAVGVFLAYLTYAYSNNRKKSNQPAIDNINRLVSEKLGELEKHRAMVKAE